MGQADEHARFDEALRIAWRALGGEDRQLDTASVVAPQRALPSVYEVGPFATACVGAALAAVAEWLELGGHDLTKRRVRVDPRHAATAFQCERLLSPLDWELPAVWDALSGDYRSADGFVRLHTIYAHHRRAALAALGAEPERDAIARRVAELSAQAVEDAVVGAGGCAAAMRSEAAWAEHPQGRAVAAEPLVAWRLRPADGTSPRRERAARPERPLAGVRILDLTRVIAGPVGTRFLAAYGAEVLRIDPPGFAEVPALLPETTTGKSCAALDLDTAAGRERLCGLAAGADVLVCGLRSDALARLGLSSEALWTHNPDLIIARIDAYGFTGPWAARRGFDSLVQMSSGIAERGMRVTGSARPRPLPAQALDHGTGYLLAAAIVRALVRRERAEVAEVALSLARSARFLCELGALDELRGKALSDDESAAFLERAESHWGPVRRVRCPAGIEGVEPRWRRDAGPLGSASPAWQTPG